MAGKKKVVVIDNHIPAVVSLSNFLEFNGFQTFQAYNKEEGKKSISSEKPDYVIIDSTLDGTAEEIVKEFPKQAFILLFHPEDHEDIKAKNIKAKIEKPVNTANLLKVLKS